MFETAFEKQPELLVSVISVVGMFAVCIVWIIAHYWRRIRQIDVEANLKQDMLNRGLSPVDIERVLWASSDGPKAPPAPEVKESLSASEYGLVNRMIDEERPVEEIERLICSIKGDRASAIKTIAAIGAECKSV